MLPVFSPLVAPIIGSIFGLIDKTVEDRDQAASIKARLQEMILSGQIKEIEAAATIISAEAQGESWLQRNWRPLLMCLFGLIHRQQLSRCPPIRHPQG